MQEGNKEMKTEEKISMVMALLAKYCALIIPSFLSFPLSCSHTPEPCGRAGELESGIEKKIGTERQKRKRAWEIEIV